MIIKKKEKRVLKKLRCKKKRVFLNHFLLPIDSTAEQRDIGTTSIGAWNTKRWVPTRKTHSKTNGNHERKSTSIHNRYF